MLHLQRSLHKYKKPFGLADCEAELEVLQDGYRQFYFHESPFSKAALADNTYLIVGRRGSGKTALRKYFSFQREISNPLCIEVSDAEVYQTLLTAFAGRTASSPEIAIPYLVKIWEFVIWSLVFHALRDQGLTLTPPYSPSSSRSITTSELVRELFEFLLGLFEGDDEVSIGSSIDTIVNDKQLAESIRTVKQFAKRRPVFIAIDTLEKYNVRNEPLMTAMAALIQFAAIFNLRNSGSDIHLKIFMSGEIFPRLKVATLLNPLKHIRDPLYLLWRPKELLRLIGWRFWRFLLEADPHAYLHLADVDWTSYADVLEKLWEPFFGRELANSNNLPERTFVYVLRHTQMRPRQLIYICNAIAEAAIAAHEFPQFSARIVRDALKQAEMDLAAELVNVFELTYPKADGIINAMLGMPKVFLGSELDKRARDTRAEWRGEAYSLPSFRQLVTELGIVGRVTKRDDRAGFIDAQFEYSARERLVITPHDECVIHPMFYSRLDVDLDYKGRVMPFSVERGEIEEMQGTW